MANEQKVTNNIKVPNKDLEILKAHFPYCFDKNGSFQIEKFKRRLDEQEISLSTESYGLDWLGKSYARLLASDPATTLLKADETHNQKTENEHAENLLFKGDNLEVLKHLVGAYYGKIKMIYIDPPYNTGSDGFVYQDDRKFTVKELQELAGIDEEKAKRILTFTRSKSNAHSAWLTFMYPRLYVAKQLLQEDGVIFVSIDDNEVAQLRLLMDEIFGEENFVGDMVWLKKRKGSYLSKQLVNLSENIICYFRNKQNKKSYLFGGVPDETESQPIIKRTNRMSVLEVEKNIISTKLNGEYKKGVYGDDVNPVELIDDVIFEDGTNKESFRIKAPFTWSQSFFEEECKKGTKPVINTINFQIRVFRVNGDGAHKGYSNVIDGVKIKGTNEDAYEELEDLMGIKKIFEFSKPRNLINELIMASTAFDKNSVILDFFAGSGTTGEAVMRLNAEDGGKRKYILVQLPEPIDPKKHKAAYDFVKDTLKAEPTIFEITKERLLRAAQKTREYIADIAADKTKKIKALESQLDLDGNPATIEGLKAEIEGLAAQDLGFKIFEIMPIWEDYAFEAEKFDPQLVLFDSDKLAQEDINALLVTWKIYDGIPPAQALRAVDLGGYVAHYGNGKLYLMDKGFATGHLKALLEKIDSDKTFGPASIIAFGFHFDSKNLREVSESVKSYANKKNIDIDFVTRY